uniref:RNA helicase n=1 Tax=Timema bartmani TaxID=61472 RepID=A0A7R9F9D3_9NEOP|nr:unnamed protein product [Timema bartmani]
MDDPEQETHYRKIRAKLIRQEYALMALPEELQALPPQAVEVYLCNVLPCDEDTVWNWSANEAMYNWVQENVAEEQEGVYMVGKSTIAGNYTHSRDRQGHLVASGRTRSPLHSPPFGKPPHVNQPALFSEFRSLSDRLYGTCLKYCKEPILKDVWTHASFADPHLSWYTQDHLTEKEEKIKKDARKDIVLSLGNTLWLNPFMARQHLEDLGNDVFIMSLRKELLNHGYAVDNPQHLEKLYSLCHDADIPVPCMNQKAETAQLNDKKYVINEQQECSIYPKEQYLLPDTIKDEVITQKSPIKENEAIKREKTILNGSDKKRQALKPQWAFFPKDEWCPVLLRSAINPNEVFVQVEKFSERWYRAQIVQITNDKKVELFFVDHGDFQFVDVDSLADIPEALIKKLPFQVCTTGPATWTGTLKYGVVMVSGTGEALSIVNQELVIHIDLGCEFLNEEIHYLDNLANPRQNLEVDENEECDTDFTDEEEFDFNFDDQESMAFMTKALGLPETLLITPEQQAPNIMKAIEMAPCLENCSSQLVDESMKSMPDGSCSPRDPVPTLSNCVRTPSVTWHQDTACVNVRIAVTDLRSYYVKCEPTRLQFRANVNEGTFTYFLDMSLYGVINIEEVACYETSCEIHVKLRKITPDSKENFKLTQNLPAGFIDIDEESDSEDEGSDTMDHRDEVYDPMDPLN